MRQVGSKSNTGYGPRIVVIGAALLLASVSASCAGGSRTVVSGPVIVVAPDTSGRALVNPAGVRPISGTLRSMVALQYVDELVGMGALVGERQCVYTHYTGWLADGTKFDSSRDTTSRGTPKEPIAFPLGARRVIAGWDAGIEGMHVGGRRRLVIPYQLAYGEAGRPPVIPERATLVFDIELLAARDTLPSDDEAPFRAGTPPRCAPWRDVSASLTPDTTGAR